MTSKLAEFARNATPLDLLRADLKIVLHNYVQARTSLESVSNGGCNWMGPAEKILNGLVENPLPGIEKIIEEHAAMKEMLFGKLGIVSGLEIVEEALKTKRRGDPSDAPFPLVGREAKLYLEAGATAYQHALEMVNSTEVIAFRNAMIAAAPSAHEQNPKDSLAQEDKPVTGKIWWSADNMTAAKQLQADLLSKGAIAVELDPDLDRRIVQVLITLDRSKSKEILGYCVKEEDWLNESESDDQSEDQTVIEEPAAPAP